MKIATFALIPLILSIGLVPVSFADNNMVMSPRQQIEVGVAPEYVIC